MERSRLTLFWGLMLGLSSCLRPAAAESKYRRCTPPLPGPAGAERLKHSRLTTGSVSWACGSLEDLQKPTECSRIFFFLNLQMWSVETVAS